MPDIKTIPQGVNADDDSRFLKKNEARWMKNVRTWRSADDDNLSVERVLGNTKIPWAKPSGDNFVVGAIPHDENNDVYIFVWNSEQNHSILKYNSITGVITVVLENSVLGFVKSGFYSGFAISAQTPSETILCWTDNTTQPKKINVQRAIYHTKLNYIDGYPNPLTLEHIRFIKYPPITAPTIEFGQDQTVSYNNISYRVFQFRYRYRYIDGEYSAYSPASKVSVSPIQRRNSSESSLTDNVYNYINVSVLNNWNDVTDIEIIVREGNNGVWRLAKTLANDTNSSTQNWRFFNDESYSLTDENDTLKNYDNVPKLAQTLEFAGNKAMFGNYTEGYNNLNQNDVDDGVSFGVRYMKNNDKIPVDISYTLSYNYSLKTASIEFDTSSITIEDGCTIDFRFVTSFLKGLHAGRPFLVDPYAVYSRWNYSWTANIGDDINDFLSDATAYFFQREAIAFLEPKTSIRTECFDVDTTGSNLKLSFIVRNEIIAASGYLSSVQLSQQSFTAIGSLSYKAGSRHPHGIVYFDEAGRHGGVQRPANNAPYSRWFSERNNIDMRGRTVVDWRIGVTPPTWAKTYQIVYGGSSSIGDFTQYTIGQVFYDINSPSASSGKNIYITLNNFKSSPEYHTDSYLESRRPLIDYKFKEGDRVRIIKEPSGDALEDRSFVEGYLDFKVLGFEYFPRNTDENPFYISGSNVRFGWTLIVQDPEVDDGDPQTPTGWSYAAVSSDVGDANTSAGRNLWYNRNNTALIEIYSPKSSDIDDIYYEFGEEYEIGDAGLETRYHKGVRDQGVQKINPIISANGEPCYIGIDFSANGNVPEYFVGDKLEFVGGTANPAGAFTVSDIVYVEGDGEWRIYFEEDLDLDIGNLASIRIHEDYLFAGGTCYNGDVWFKTRELIMGSPPRKLTYESVEDYYSNDFVDSRAWNKGRPHVYSTSIKEERRKATVTWSGDYFPENKINGLNSFNSFYGDVQFEDYDRSLGSIQLIKRRGDNMILYQENKVSLVKLGKENLTTGEGSDIVIKSKDVVSKQVPYAGDYGICMNPESFAEKDGRHYFVDIKRGKALRLGGNGLEPISDFKFSRVFDELSKQYMGRVNSSAFKIYGGIDREYDEYVVTFDSVTLARVEKGGQSVGFDTANIVDDGSNLVIRGLSVSTGNPTTGTIDGGGFDKEVTRVNLATVSESGVVVVTSEELETASGSQSDITVNLTVEEGEPSNDIAQYRTATSELAIPKSNTSSTFAITTASIPDVPKKTYVFSEDGNRWLGEREYNANGYTRTNYLMLSFDENGDIWKHNQVLDYDGVTPKNVCDFYDEQKDSVVVAVLNDAPSNNKVLQSLSLESDNAWDVTDIDSNLGNTSFGLSRFNKREGIWYSDVPTMESQDDQIKANRFGLGMGTAQNATDILFANAINNSSVRVGDTIKNADLDEEMIVTGIIDDFTVSVDSTGGLGSNEFLFVERASDVDGEPMRGAFFEVTLTDSSTDQNKLFAVNGRVFDSKKTLDNK